jgi:hypothetical protein
VCILEDSDVTLGVVLPNGKCEVNDFIAALPKIVRARFRRFLERLRDGQQIKTPEHMRYMESDSLGNQLHELKNHKPAVRLYLFKLAEPVGSTRWIATHGTEKVKDSRVPAEMERAWKIFYTWRDSD